MDTTSELANAAREAALGVSDYLLDAFEQSHEIALKADFHDVVTVHDKESQRRIVASLFEAFPDSVIVGEESSELITRDGSVRSITNDDIVWYVDPIDGTSNFASGFDQWCVSIAAARAGELLAGVIYQPTSGMLYLADSTGAYRNGSPIHVLEVAPSQGIVATEYPSPRVPDPEAAMRGYLDVLHTARSLRRTGSSALMLAGVAAGTFVASFNVGTHSWDIAAGALLVKRAGGRYIGYSDQAAYMRNAHEAPNYCAAGSPEAALLCLRAAGHPDPQAAVDAAWNRD